MLFTEDCDYVIVSGGNTHGREALEKSFGNNFNTNLKDSTRTDSIRRTRFLSSDIVSLDYWVLNVPGADRPRREGYYTWIVIRENGRWLIALHHAAQFPDPQPAPASRLASCRQNSATEKPDGSKTFRSGPSLDSFSKKDERELENTRL
jgi:uncharacterized protein (TIGR02246 family)